jgi:uncharacterized protein YkwD
MLSRRRVATLIATAAALALATPAGAQAADCGAAADSVPDASNLTQVGQATLCLLNNERGAQGLRPVTEAPGLTQPSLAYSARMVAESFFAHESPDGGTLVDRLTAVGYIAPDGDWAVGENIAWGQGELSTPRSIVAAWMASPGHRKNILTGEYTEIGLGVVTGTPGDTSWGATYTTDFGAVQRDLAVEAMTATSASPRPSAARKAKTTRTAKRCKVTRTSARAAKAAKAVKGTKKGAKKGAKAKRASSTCGTAPRARRKAA